ncbi:MAG: hypothetical protein OJJ55_18970 [Rhodococcus sp.]|nr:hypothetical protein [Rhodococcus sp. (in: high G+C Gram-positive bacteria)]
MARFGIVWTDEDAVMSPKVFSSYSDAKEYRDGYTPYGGEIVELTEPGPPVEYQYFYPSDLYTLEQAREKSDAENEMFNDGVGDEQYVVYHCVPVEDD